MEQGSDLHAILLLSDANRSSKKLPQPDKSRREIEVTIPIISLDQCLSELHNTDLMCSMPSKSDPICASRKHPHHRKGKKIFSPIQPQSNENQVKLTCISFLAILLISGKIVPGNLARLP